MRKKLFLTLIILITSAIILLGIVFTLKLKQNNRFDSTANIKSNLTIYKDSLAKLADNKPESIIKGKDAYFKYFSLKDKVEDRDYAFKYFLSFYKSVIDKINQANQELSTNDTLNQGLFDNNGVLNNKLLTKRENYYKAYGLQVKSEAAEYYLDSDYNFLIQTFSKYLSAAWQEYLIFLMKESKEGFTYDAELTIPWDKMRERIIFLESFLNKYPNFTNRDEIQTSINQYLYFYLVGVDNSPISAATLSNGDNSLYPEVKKSYETFIRVNKDSKYRPIVLEYYELLKNYNFKVQDYIYKFINKKKLNTY